MSEEKSILSDLHGKLFSSSWPMWIGAIILSMLSLSLWFFFGPWGATGGYIWWGNEILGLLETPTAGWENYAYLNMLIVFGAFASALLAKEFAIRIPPIGELVKGLIGGLLMGIGAVIGGGCTIGGFFSGWPALSAAGLFIVLGFVIGVFIAVRYLLWEAVKYPNISSGESKTFLAGGSWQPIVGFIVLLAGFGVLLIFDLATQLTIIGAVLIGLLIGFVLQRSRFCITAALREPFMTGDAAPAKAIMTGILVGLVGFVAMKITGTGTELSMVASSFFIPALLGGTIFGMGMTIAGGCVVGSLWRSGEGQVKLWLSVVGLTFGTLFTAKFIKTPIYDLFSPTQEFLPTMLGGGLVGYFLGALVIVVIIALWYFIVSWNERSGKLQQM
jgi:uncharacterized membrane protein YedE/YeeE